MSETDSTMLFKMAYARDSFSHVKAVCDYIADNNIGEDAPIYVPFCTAIWVLYARPFTVGRGVGSLSENIVPSSSRDLHDQLLRARHQVAAHSDAEADSYGKEGPPINNVRVIVRGTERSLATFEVKFSAHGIGLIRSLAETLIEKTLYHIQKLWNRMQRSLPTSQGEYLLDVKTSKFQRADWKGKRANGEPDIFLDI